MMAQPQANDRPQAPRAAEIYLTFRNIILRYDASIAASVHRVNRGLRNVTLSR